MSTSNPMNDICIRLNREGTKVQGAAFRRNNGEMTAISEAQLPDVLAALNTAALATLSEQSVLISRHERFIAQLKTEHEAELKKTNDAALSAIKKAGEAAEAEIEKVKKEKEVEFFAAYDALQATQGELDATKASLTEHQTISDGLVVKAKAALLDGNVDDLLEIMEQATLFGKAREAVRLKKEADALQAKLDELNAQRAALGVEVAPEAQP